MVPSGSGKPARLVPYWDPAASSALASEVLAATGIDALLIGRLAVHAWLGPEREVQYTKDLDLAVRHSDLAALVAWAEERHLHLRPLQLGGVQVTDASGEVHIDFIHRTSAEYGNLGPLIEAALRAAVAQDLKADVRGRALWLCPLHELCVLKFAAGRPKDEDDLRALLALPDCDVAAVRRLVLQHMGPFSQAAFDRFIERYGHPLASRYATGES